MLGSAEQAIAQHSLDPMEDELYQITLSYACAGVIIRKGRVVEAAPILAWMVGRTVATVRLWVMKKRGQMKLISQQGGATRGSANQTFAGLSTAQLSFPRDTLARPKSSFGKDRSHGKDR
jgi:hypothetical protein